MAVNRRLPRLICYDIRDHRRLARLHRMISRHALMVQYSMYLDFLTERELDALEREIRTIIAEGEDDVRIYTLPERPCGVCLGPDPFEGLPGFGLSGILSASEAEE